MKKHTKILPLLFASVLTLGGVVSCGESKKPETNQPGDNGETDNGGNEGGEVVTKEYCTVTAPEEVTFDVEVTDGKVEAGERTINIAEAPTGKYFKKITVKNGEKYLGPKAVTWGREYTVTFEKDGNYVITIEYGDNITVAEAKAFTKGTDVGISAKVTHLSENGTAIIADSTGYTYVRNNLKEIKADIKVGDILDFGGKIYSTLTVSHDFEVKNIKSSTATIEEIALKTDEINEKNANDYKTFVEKSHFRGTVSDAKTIKIGNYATEFELVNYDASKLTAADYVDVKGYVLGKSGSIKYYATEVTKLVAVSSITGPETIEGTVTETGVTIDLNATENKFSVAPDNASDKDLIYSVKGEPIANLKIEDNKIVYTGTDSVTFTLEVRTSNPAVKKEVTVKLVNPSEDLTARVSVTATDIEYTLLDGFVLDGAHKANDVMRFSVPEVDGKTIKVTHADKTNTENPDVISPDNGKTNEFTITLLKGDNTVTITYEVAEKKDSYVYNPSKLKIVNDTVTYTEGNIKFEWNKGTSSNAISIGFDEMRLYVGHTLTISRTDNKFIDKIILAREANGDPEKVTVGDAHFNADWSFTPTTDVTSLTLNIGKKVFISGFTVYYK